MVSEEMIEAGGRKMFSIRSLEGQWDELSERSRADYCSEAIVIYLAMRAAESPLVGEVFERLRALADLPMADNAALGQVEAVCWEVSFGDLRTLLAMSRALGGGDVERVARAIRAVQGRLCNPPFYSEELAQAAISALLNTDGERGDYKDKENSS